MSDADGLTITQAGRASMIAPDGKGTQAVAIAEIAVGNGRYTPTPSQTELVSETKRLSSIAGSAQNPDVMDVKLLDESTDTYEVGEFGLFLGDGTLFAVYSHPAGPLYEKVMAAAFGITFNVAVVSIDATQITFPTAEFATPTATRAAHGVVRLATPAEARAGTDKSRAITPATARDAFTRFSNSLLVAQLPHVETGERKFDVFEEDGRIVLSFGQTWVWRGVRRFATDDFDATDRGFGYDPDRQYHLRWHAPGHGTAQPAGDYPSGRFVLNDITDAYNAGRADLGAEHDSHYDDMLIADCGARGGGSFRIRRLINAAKIRDDIRITDTPTPAAANTSAIEGAVATDYAVRPFVSWDINFDSDDGGSGNPDHDTFVNLMRVDRSGIDYRVMRDHTRSIALNLFLMAD